MIITVGKVNAVITPDKKCAVLFEKSTKRRICNLLGVTYTHLLKACLK